MASVSYQKASAPSAPVLGVRPRSLSRRHLIDTIARWVVSLGGLATIGSIAAILGFICIEVYPLLQRPSVTLRSTFSLGQAAPVLLPMVDEQRRVLGFVEPDGKAHFLNLEDGERIASADLALGDAEIVATARARADHGFVATSDGHLKAFHMTFQRRLETGERIVDPQLTVDSAWDLPAGAVPARLVAVAPKKGSVIALFAGDDGAARLLAVTEKESFLGGVERLEVDRALASDAQVTALALGSDGARGFVGTESGELYYWDLADPSAPRLVDRVSTTGSKVVPITALQLLIGDQSLVVGDGLGRVDVWFPVRDAERGSGWRLERVHRLQQHDGAVTAVAVSPRGRSFLTADAKGRAFLHHSTTSQTLAELAEGAGRGAVLLFAPKADSAVAVAGDGRVRQWEIDSPHPETTLSTLFGKTWYEGYPEAEYVWQSTGGSDAFEPKLSLIPLIFGTFKGTLYALLFAIPLSVLAALYTSQFAHPRLRSLVKPTVEIMAALPSVVLGFLAGLWLAPAIEDEIPGVLAAIFFVPLLMFGCGAVWRSLPLSLRRWVYPGTEPLILIPIIIAGVQLCIWANPWIEALFFDGNFRQWLFGSAGLRYDQRNCLVIGFAMGFAVIPIIFTIAEDALSNVPRRLISGSLALGATPWQTAIRVVLPTASAGIFSAIMIGFGRAVGETMIVLMATGNTPIMDWNPFTGMRTLSANIAVEMPEAPVGSTLYRVLFLTALLLFVTTFFVNTAAELVRVRLRRRYEAL